MPSPYHVALRLNHYLLGLKRRLPRPSLRRVHRLPPIDAARGPVELLVLTTPRCWLEGLWSAYSWLSFVGAPLTLHMYVDGAVGDAQRREFSRLFPGGVLTAPIDVNPTSVSPSFAAMCAHNRFGAKLALLTLHNQRASFLFSDSDILLFRRPDELVEAIRTSAPIFACDLKYDNFDPWIARRTQELGLGLPARLNSGLLFLPRETFSLDLARRLTAGWTPADNDFFLEQTFSAAMLSAAGGRPLPAEEYLTSCDGMLLWRRDATDLANVVTRHYSGVVRHRFYEQGLPWLEQRMLAASPASAGAGA